MEETNRKFAVSAREVCKHFGEGEATVKALKGVSLEVRLGELMMIVGPSGCGKTTFLSVIAGTLDIDSGEVMLFEQSLQHMNGREKTRYRGQNIGFIFQQYNLIPTLTSAENVSIPLMINGWKFHQAQKKAAEVLEIVGIAEKRDALPSKLSGGQQQRVAIARALAHEPRLIICDEPTAALDGENGAKIMDLLKKIAANPERAVVVVTHDNRIFKFADRVAEMDDGVVKNIHDEYHGTH